MTCKFIFNYVWDIIGIKFTLLTHAYRWILGSFEDLLKPNNFRHIKNLDDHFYEDVANGDLADFTWMQPRMTTQKGQLPSWQHPDASVKLGEQLIKDVYEALRASPKWNETLLLITYDEHGKEILCTTCCLWVLCNTVYR